MEKHEIREKYTVEYCPFCDNEQVIYSEGITACPSCGKPLAPCSMCEDCSGKCPYGCNGSHDESLKITNPKISEEKAHRLYALL